MSLPTYRDALAFILAHRKGAAFRGMSEAEIIMELKSAADCRCLAYALNEDDSISGIVTGCADHETRTLFVYECLCIHRIAMLSMCCIFDTQFKGYTIQAIRDDSRDITHAFKYKDTNKLITKLAAMSARGLRHTTNPKPT